MNSDNHPSSCRASDPSTTISAAVWAVCYLGSLWALKHQMIDGWIKIALAVLPVIPFAVFLRRFISHLRQFDELHRRIHLEALGYAFPLSILFFMLLGLLEVANVLSPNDFGYRHVWFYLPFFYAVGLFLSWRRYK